MDIVLFCDINYFILAIVAFIYKSHHFHYEALKIQYIIGMRNRLVHAYFDVDLDILWNTATIKLEPLIEQLEEIILLEN